MFSSSCGSESDARASYSVFFDAVRNGGDRHYDAAQRHAWVPSAEMPDWWSPHLASARTWVTEQDGTLTGLISLRSDGYLDLFYVVASARGDGTAVTLYETLLREAEHQGAQRLTTHASDYLKPFLEKRGWIVVAEDIVERGGVRLRRWEMVLDQAAESQRL